MMECEDKKPSSIRKAALMLKEWFLADFPSEESPADRPASKEKSDFDGDNKPVSDPEKINQPLTFELKDLDPKHEWFETREILPETVKYFGLGLQKKGKTIPNRIAIPIHDHCGQLVAYCGRAVDKSQIRKEGKYKMAANFVKSEVIYNLHGSPKK